MLSGPAEGVTDLNERPAGLSHLLAADDVLSPGRWGAYITLCGAEQRAPRVTAALQASVNPRAVRIWSRTAGMSDNMQEQGGDIW